MRKLFVIVMALILMMSSASAYVDCSGFDDETLQSLLDVATFFEPMTHDQILEFISDIKTEIENRKWAKTENIKGTEIYEDETMRLVLRDYFIINDDYYGPVSIIKLEWTNKQKEATTRTRVFNIAQYQDGVELNNAYITEYDNESITSVRGGSTLAFYLPGVLRNTYSNIELVFDMAYDYRNQFDDITINIPVL